MLLICNFAICSYDESVNKLNNQKTIFVGLSGGVDSSVSAYLLKKEGLNVVGAFIKIWQSEFDETCTWKEDRRDAMRVAAHLEIPFVTIDLSDEYKKNVIDYMIKEYKEGRTPNPDVMCNKQIKFGVFLKKAIEMGADAIATGHYARKVIGDKCQVIEKREDLNSCNLKPITYNLLKALDRAKEQSYFLWTLNQDQLSKAYFPVGHLQKEEVRKIAKKAGIPTFDRKDSQGLCFIGKVDFKDFLKTYIKEEEGKVLNEKGEVVGTHKGVAFLTIGERRGFEITKKGTDDEPLFVIAKDIENNTITVTNRIKNLESVIKNEDKIIEIKNTNWINGEPEKDKTYEAQIRYHGELLKCKIETKNNTAKIFFEKPELVASGQSIVVYSGEECVGGGVVK